MRIYCDGACKGNPGRSGAGIAIYKSGEALPSLLYGGADIVGTNNIAELKALNQALSLASKHNGDVQIFTDSQYSINCITLWAYSWKKAGWKKNGGDIKNLSLIKEAHAAYESMRERVSIKYVKGHAGTEGNELADRMAIHASRKGNDDFIEYPYKNVVEVLAIK